jgi:uncharacterized protein YjbI with pentapeptide repeats
MNERKSAPTAAEPPSPDGLATPSSPSVTNEPNLPPIAADADDLEAIKKAVDDAASVGGGLWLSYLFVLFYLAVAGGAVTHADLFFENPVKLPFLNVELPLLAFFFLAPILFLFVHAYTLVHLVFLTEKGKRFDEAVRRQRTGEDGLRQGLPSNIFIQFLAGPPKVRAGPFGWLLRVIAWSTLAVAPILLLLLFQLQFLPFHNSFITWSQRIVLLADLGLIWWLWRTILTGRDPVKNRPWARRAWGVVGIALSVFVVLFSLTAATFPGEWQEDHLLSAVVFPAINPSKNRDRQSTQQTAQSVLGWAKEYWIWARTSEKVSLHDWIFNSEVDPTSRRRWLPFSNTLVLTGLNVYEALKIDDPEKVKWRDYVFLARDRDLKGAIFDFAGLPKIDFTGANLEGASLEHAQLDHVSFEDAQLRHALLSYAQLNEALLNRAHLQGAILERVNLQNSSLDGAELQLSWLDYADLRGASLKQAQLGGARLVFAQLQNTSLDGVGLQGAVLAERRTYKEPPSKLIFREQTSMSRNCRARRLPGLSLRGQHSRMPIFKAHLSTTPNFRQLRSILQS